MIWIYLALLVWFILAAGLLLSWHRLLWNLWLEPAFTFPILLVESDDWGAGSEQQAQALAALSECLGRHRDASGHPAVMTLALVLATPEAGMVAGAPWRRRTLATPALQQVLAAIAAGRESGVFALQLHGMEHFWPNSVLAAAQNQPQVQAWLADPELTETLPSPLQSRWTDAAVLPSRPHPSEEVQAAVSEEIALYTELFGSVPTVVVPPTFVWTEEVESAWAAAGVEIVVTPGRRHTCRDAAGRPAGVDRQMLNGERGAGGLIYLVRDDYFEPKYGHTPEQAMAALAHKSDLGRPCLLETHRWNFLTATEGDLVASLAALDETYTRALNAYPNLRFASSEELGRAIHNSDPHWIEQDVRRRFTIWLYRAVAVPRFGKLARLIGLITLLNLFARPQQRQH